MREDVLDRHTSLAVLGELRDVLTDRIVDVQQMLLIEQVHDHRGDRFGRGEQTEGRVGRDQLLPRLGRIGRTVPGGMPDGPVDQHLATAPHTELQGGMQARAVEAFHRPPDVLDASRVDANAARRDFIGACRHGIEGRGNA